MAEEKFSMELGQNFMQMYANYLAHYKNEGWKVVLRDKKIAADVEAMREALEDMKKTKRNEIDEKLHEHNMPLCPETGIVVWMTRTQNALLERMETLKEEHFSIPWQERAVKGIEVEIAKLNVVSDMVTNYSLLFSIDLDSPRSEDVIPIMISGLAQYPMEPIKIGSKT